MTMRVIFLKDSHGFDSGKWTYLERSLARRLCEQDVCMPYNDWLKLEEEKVAKAEAAAKQEKKEAKAEAKEANAEAAEEKKAALIEAKSEDKAEKAILRKAHKREKS